MVSTYALHKMLAEFEKSARTDFNRQCTGVFQQVIGLFCAHTLCRCTDISMAVYGSNVHRHWYFNPVLAEESIQLIFNP